MDDIAETLREWEALAGLKTNQAAVALLIDPDRYRRIRTGKQTPNGEELLRIREVLRRAELKGDS